MQREILIVGVNHRSAPVEVREQVAIGNGVLEESLQRLLTVPSIEEGVILSTCNRVEVVAASTDGDHAVEALTDRLERDAGAYIQRIDDLGGIVRAIEIGYPQQEIAESAYRFQQQLDRGEKVMVGVNRYQMEESPPLELLRIGPEVERRQAQRVRERKQARDAAKVRTALAAVKRAAAEGTNLMPPIIAAVQQECTVGEIADIYRAVFGVYRDPAWI